MKKSLLNLSFLLASITVYGQEDWTINPGTASITSNVGIGIPSPNGRLHVRGGSMWSQHNYGATLIIDGPRHNAIGILDFSNSNPVAIANHSGNLIIAKMPPVGDQVSNPE